MIENIYLLIEIISSLLVLWALHGCKKRPGIYTLAFICISLIVENAIYLEWISASFIIVPHIGFVFLDILEFKDSIKNAILYVFFQTIILFILQSILGMMFIVFLHIKFFATEELLILQIILFCIAVIIYFKIDLQKVCKIFMNNNIISSIVLIVLAIICFFYIIRFHLQNMFNLENFIYIATFFIVVLALIFEWQRETFINKQKSAELELFKQYDSIYHDLILNMRKRQHDFNNHLQAIFSMNMAAKSLDDLIKQQNKYCKELMENNQDSIFLKEDINSVYLAFLYVKKKNAEEMGIEVRYRFDCRDIESHLSFMDFITVLGNLLDNATEALQSEDHKKIILEILQQDNSVLIHVFNTYNFTDGELPADFFLGKSKKGEGHGLGLSNVTDVVKRYHGIMETTFGLIEQEKFYKVSLRLFLKE